MQEAQTEIKANITVNTGDPLCDKGRKESVINGQHANASQYIEQWVIVIIFPEDINVLNCVCFFNVRMCGFKK